MVAGCVWAFYPIAGFPMPPRSRPVARLKRSGVYDGITAPILIRPIPARLME